MLICFDLGGVLVRICRSWHEGCRAADVPLRPFDAGESHEEDRDELIEANQSGALEAAAFFQRMSDLFGGHWSPSEIGRVHEAWILGPYPGTAQMVRDLNAMGHATACLSNTDAAHWIQLLQDEAISLLHHRHASHLLQMRKPDPAIWTTFEQAVGHLPGEIVFFDDLEENVESARHAGWDAILVDPDQDTVPQMRSALQERGLL
ncbi:MAG: HAD-IA family hydrolase [Phycisphaerales bacterium]|nr:HAD-IA family hydrolase [Phycisphaerales bacterium]